MTTVSVPEEIRGFSFPPVNIKQYLYSVLGGRQPLTVSDFSKSDLDAIRYAVENQIKKTGKNEGVIGYGDYSPQWVQSVGDPRTTALQVLYESMTNPAYRMETTLGMAKYLVNPKGEIEVMDSYDFNAPRSMVNDIRSKQNALSILMDAYKSHGIFGVGNAAGNMFGAPENEGKPYTLNLGSRK